MQINKYQVKSHPSKRQGEGSLFEGLGITEERGNELSDFFDSLTGDGSFIISDHLQKVTEICRSKQELALVSFWMGETIGRYSTEK